MKIIYSRSADETKKIGSKLSRSLKGTLVVGISGCLGAGKTVLVKGIAKGVGIDERKVASPTFVL